MDESWQVEEAPEWINTLTEIIYKRNVEAGWYTDLATGELKERNVGEMLALVHSEVSEALEGYRKNLQDDKLPHRKMVEVELADAVIRICDLIGYLKLDLGGAIAEKMEYNLHRADHKIENRKAEGGKKI
jgi:NTP pyrophosphatase (non-canonical NTP hydrolase)